MISPVVDKTIKQLKKADLSTEDRIALVTALISKLHALPIRDSVVIDPKGLIVNGKQLGREQMISFQQSCVVLKDNLAKKAIFDQVRYLATKIGVHQALNESQIMFGKVGIWVINEIEILVDKIALGKVSDE